MSDRLFSLSPLDGRYHNLVGHLPVMFSEAGLMMYRLKVEVEYLIFMSDHKGITDLKPFSKKLRTSMRKIYEDFDLEDARAVKDIEAVTRHDVKAIEYFLKDELKSLSLFPESALEYVHFCCTSEDINNLSYALMIKDGLAKEYVPQMKKLATKLKQLGKKWKKVPMLSLTHGQPATPTTLGKELMVTAMRVERQLEQIKAVKIMGKFSGATGNWNAHLVAYPEVNWRQFSTKFIKSLKLEPNLWTTQIESHDWNAEIFDAAKRLNNVLIGSCRDIWMYVSRGIFKQRVLPGEVGSSTMPHKVNPIQFENAEGNFDVANGLFIKLADKLPISRMQRDLSDSTVQRSMGTAFGYSMIAVASMMKGFDKLDLDRAAIRDELNARPEVLAEPIQTVMRRYGVANAYEKLKKVTQGKDISLESLRDLVKKLEIPPEDKKRLIELTPETYIGLAGEW